MDLDKIYVIGSGRIPEYLIGLGMRPLVFTGYIPPDGELVIHAAFQRPETDDSKYLRQAAEVSLACLNQQVMMVFVSDDSVFGDGDGFSEGRAKDPQTLWGMMMLACEAIVKVDGHQTIRVPGGDFPSGIYAYLEMFKRVPQTLHLGSKDDRLSMNKARKLGIYG